MGLDMYLYLDTYEFCAIKLKGYEQTFLIVLSTLQLFGLENGLFKFSQNFIILTFIFIFHGSIKPLNSNPLS